MLSASQFFDLITAALGKAIVASTTVGATDGSGWWIGRRCPSPPVTAAVVGACAAAAAAVATAVVPTAGDVFASGLERLLVGCAGLLGLAAGWQLGRSRRGALKGAAMIAILQAVCFGVGAAGVYMSSVPPGG